MTMRVLGVDYYLIRKIKCLEIAGVRGTVTIKRGATSARQMRQISFDNKDWNEDKNQVRIAQSRPPLLTDLRSFYAAVLRVTKTFCHGAIKISRCINHTCPIIDHCCTFFQIRLRQLHAAMCLHARCSSCLYIPDSFHTSLVLPNS